MVELYFQKYLNKQSIDKIRENNGFKNSLAIEKFIMNFEVFIHIQKILPDCVVKGGMAVPFHLHDKTLHRLSEDIDVVTRSSREKVIKAMKNLSKDLKGKVNIGDPHIPKTRTDKKLPLLTYFCDYQSSIDGNSQMKIEIFYENDMKIKSKKIDAEISIIGFPINFPLSIYEHGSLIGDKLTTLPFNTIGIDSSRKIDVPKQIYDIATLIKSLPNDIPMKMIIDTFKKITNNEISYFHENEFTIEDVLEDLDVFSDTLLIAKNQIQLNPSYRGRFEKFTTEMLGNTRYPNYAHVTDILLIKLIVKLILKKFNGIKLEIITEKAKQVLAEFTSLSNMNNQTKVLESKKIIAKHGKLSDKGKIMKDLLYEQAYLYDQLFEIDSMTPSKTYNDKQKFIP